MRFDFTVHADSPAELGEVLRTIQDALPVGVFTQPMRGFAVTVSPNLYLEQATAPPIALPPSGKQISEPATMATPTTPTAPTTPTTPAATTKRGSKAAAASRTPPAPPQDADPLGLDGPTSQDAPPSTSSVDPLSDLDSDTTPDLDPEPEPAPETAPPGLVGVAAKNKALELLRLSYAAPAGMAAVRALQKEYGGTKFAALPDDKGAELLARAEAIHAKLPK